MEEEPQIMETDVAFKNKSRAIASRITLATGAGLVLVGIIMAVYVYVTRSNVEELRCIVQGFEIVLGEDADKTDAKILKVQDVNRKHPPFSFEDETFAFGTTYKTGSEIRVYYNKDNPSKSEIVNWWTQYFIAAMLSFFGLMDIFASLIIFRLVKHADNGLNEV